MGFNRSWSKWAILTCPLHGPEINKATFLSCKYNSFVFFGSRNQLICLLLFEIIWARRIKSNKITQCMKVDMIFAVERATKAVEKEPGKIQDWREPNPGLCDNRTQCSVNQTWIFQALFQSLRLFILLRRSCSLSYLYPQFKIWFIPYI